MTTVKHLLRRKFRQLGYDIIRFGPDGSLAGLLHALFQRLEINCVIDVGAHYGEYGQFLRDVVGYGARIVSFEPVAASFAVLEQHCRSDGRWKAQQTALGSRDGSGSMHLMHNSVLSSFLSPSRSGNWATRLLDDRLTVEGHESVPMRRLDGLFRECVEGIPEPRVYLKMDTQGWDLQVLEGAAGCLAAIRALQSEVSVQPIYEGMPNYVDSIAEMSRFGFEPAGMFPVTQDDLLRAIEFDCVMVHTSSSSVQADLTTAHA